MKHIATLLLVLAFAACSRTSPPPDDPDAAFRHILKAGGAYSTVLNGVTNLVQVGASALRYQAVLAGADETRETPTITLYYFRFYAMGDHPTGPGGQGDGYILIKVDKQTDTIKDISGNIEGH